MTEFVVQCPSCGQKHRVDEKSIGRNLQCAGCGTGFVVATEAQIPAEWKVGDVILDLYEVKQIHQSGGMGLVYRVHHRGWNMDLAVKSPRLGYFQTEAQKENFSRECEAWINLGLHPHIVSCYYVRTLGGIPRVFAEYIEGGSLKDGIVSRKVYEGGPQVALERILDVAIQVAWGLQHAHDQGLVHQDVKPANVLLTPDGTAKVSDFGLAKARVAAGEDFVAGGVQRSILVSCGGMTPAYCSPEQFDRQRVTRRTDIWSWGLSVLEMFVGEVGWPNGITAPAVLERLDDLRLENAGIPGPPGELVELLEECFAWQADDRPENFRMISARLLGIYESVAGQAYNRELPEAAKLHADALNNRAVSLLDLGKAEEAEMAFDEALVLEPGHPQTIYNRGLHLWRNARMTDDLIVNQLAESRIIRPNDWNVPYLLGWLQMERCEIEGAAAAFSTAKQMGGGEEAGRALAEARGRDGEILSGGRIFEGHTDKVESVALSGDGRCALSGSRDKTVRLWEISSGVCLRIFKGHSDQVHSVAISKDGSLALSGSSDKTLRLWEVTSGKCLRVFEGHTKHVHSVALSGDGRSALSGIGDELRLWDVSSGRCIRKLEGHEYGVASVALSVDGRLALSGSADCTLRLWDVSSGSCLRIFKGHQGWLTSAVMSADCKWGLSGSDDRNLRLWDLRSGKCVRIFEGHTGGVGSVSLSSNNRWALSVGGHGDRTLRLWEVSSGRCIRTFEGHTGNVCSVALNADGRFALSTGCNDRLIVWNLRPWLNASRTMRVQMAVCQLAEARETVALQKHFRTLICKAEAALTANDVGRAWRLATKAKAFSGHGFSVDALDLAHRAGLLGRRIGLQRAWCLRSLEGHSNDVSSVALSMDGRRGLSGSWDLTLRLWDLNSGNCIMIYGKHNNSVQSVALSSDGHWALSGSYDLRLWELRNSRTVRIFEGQTGITAVSMSLDGYLALAGYEKKSLCLWEVGSGRCLRTFDGHTGSVWSVALSADGRSALSGSGGLYGRRYSLSGNHDLRPNDNTVRLWEVASGRCLRIFDEHAGWVTSVALNREGFRALSGSSDCTLRLWDVFSGECLQIFEGHTGGVTCVALSVDERWAISGSEDRTLRLWEVSSGRCLKIFEGHTREVTSVALSADGRWVLSGSRDKTLRLWELEWYYEFPGPQDWDEGAKPCLETFLTLHCRLGDDGFSRVGKPQWMARDFHKLLIELQYRGFGWLRSEGVWRQLEKMTAEWKGPPDFPGIGREP